MTYSTILGAGAMAGLLAWGGLGGLGLTVRLSSRRLPVSDRVIAFGVWSPLWVATLALALAHAGVFSIPRLMGLSALWGACGAWGLWSAGRRTETPVLEGPVYGKLYWAGGVAVLALAGFLATPANRYLGAWDTGVYVGTAMEVARSGGLEVRDEFLAELPEGEREAFMHEGDPARPAWHAGFVITDADAGRLMPEFYHLYPAWLAVWGALFGLEGVWAGQTAMALYALAMVMLAGASLFGRGASLLAGLALMACAAQAYAMKMTSAEMITQFGLFGGLWALDRVLRAGRGAGGLMATAALAWAGAILAHGTALLPVTAGLTFLFAHALIGRRDAGRWRAFGVVALCAGLAVVWNGIRADAMTRFLVELILAHPAWWCGAAVVGGLLIAAAWHWGSGNNQAARMGPAWLERVAPMVVVGALVAFGYWARPVLFPGREAQNVRYFVMLTGWIGMGLAIGFLGWRRVRDWPAGQQAFVFMGLATTLVLLVNKMAKPFYLWGSRRWVELALPAVFLLAAAVVAQLAAWGGGKRRFGFGAATAGLCAVVWLGLMAPRAALVYRTREYAGVPGLMARAAEAVRDADRVFCDHWDAAAVLRYVHGLPAWALTRLSQVCGVADAQVAVAHLRRWAGEGKRVYWIGSWFADPSLRLMKAGDFELDTTLVEQRGDRLPDRAVAERRRLTIYRVTLEGGDAPPAELAMGYSAMGLTDGFLGLRKARDEQGRRFGYRRTRGRGRWYAPRIPGAWRIRLINENPKRRTIPATLLADGVQAAAWQVGAGWADYEFEMPAGSNRVALLELVSPTYRSGKMRVGVGVAGMSKAND